MPHKNVKNYITPPGAARLKSELKELLLVKRPELVKTIEWAASNGDRSENADYIYGKRRLREIDRRIRTLTSKIGSMEIIDPSSQRSNRIHFGARVTLKNEMGQVRKYQIVGTDEIEVKNGQISWQSPLAKALLNSKVGDIVTLKAPQGDSEFEVVLIEY